MNEDWLENEDDSELTMRENRAATRRKNDWKFAKRKRNINNYLDRQTDRPLHYFSKNSPWKGYSLSPNKTNNKGSRRYISKNYAAFKNWNEHDKRQIDDFENQLIELSEEN